MIYIHNIETDKYIYTYIFTLFSYIYLYMYMHRYKYINVPLHKKCPYLGLIWSAFSRICSKYGDMEYLSTFSPNVGKCRPE